MITAQELRVGNWVDYSGRHMQVATIDPIMEGSYGGILKDDQRMQSILDETDIVQPIPLTPEILEKCGFFRNEYEKFIFNHISRSISLFEAINNSIRLRCDTHQVLIDHLHQLQNLYFALTGEELNYQP